MRIPTGDSSTADRAITGGISVLVLFLIVLAVAIVVGLVVVFGGGPVDGAV